MRRLIIATLLSVTLSGTTGCFLPIYSGDPARRTQQLIYTSENLRSMQDAWERFWFLDQPDHMHPAITNGGLL